MSHTEGSSDIALVYANIESELGSLKRARTVRKAKLTREEKWIDKVQSPDDTSLAEAQLRLASLTTAFKEFEEIQDKIERISTDLSDSDQQRELVENQYFQTKAFFTQLVDAFVASSRTPNVSIPSESDNPEGINRSLNTIPIIRAPTNPSIFGPELRLPPISLPSFSGNPEEFQPFSELFCSLIDESPNLTDTARFHYLRSALKDSAAEVLSNLPALGTNYSTAWELRTDRFLCRGTVIERLNLELIHLPAISSESHTALRRLADAAIRIVRSLKSMDQFVEGKDSIYVSIIYSKLDPFTRRDFKLSLPSTDSIPTFSELYAFLDRRIKTLESLNPIRKEGKPFFRTTAMQAANLPVEKSRSSNRFTNNGNSKNWSNTNNYKTQRFIGFNTRLSNGVDNEFTGFNFTFCNDKSHRLGQCKAFRDLSVPARREYVLKNNHCLNCLAKTHKVECCPSKFSCFSCNRKHHSSLCENQSTSTPSFNSEDQSSQPTPAAAMLNSNSNSTQCLLSTATILVCNSRGIPHTASALFDSGSQAGFITQRLADILQLPTVSTHLKITGVGTSKNVSRNRVFAQIKSRYSNYSENVELFVLPQICTKLPPSKIDTTSWRMPQGLQLADETFFLPKNIDILLGASTFFKILFKGRIHATVDRPALLHTQFGWVLGGEIPHAPPSRDCHIYLSLSDNVERLWRLDECSPAPTLTPEEIQCEKHFKRTHSRAPDGRFIVRLPFKKDPETLGHSRSQARRRWLAVEERLSRDPSLARDYSKFIKDYITSGHMSLLDPESEVPEAPSQFYLPHHPIFKNDSSTTKLRVVFDGSARTSNGSSLNQILMTGPKTQGELFDILLQFRIHKFVFTSDVAQMFRQILLANEDRKHQLIFWREKPTEPLEVYQLNTVTYGMAPSPFLATRCLNQLAEVEGHNFPSAAKAISSFYVDDLICGHDSLTQALTIQNEMIQMLASAGFPLRKWSANHTELLKNIPSTDHEPSQMLDIFSSDVIKALGLFWQPTSDIFTYDVSKILRTPATTKRQVLSQLASLYDPLGIVGPIVCYAKIFVQNLWNLKLDWDQPIPPDLAQQWASFSNSLQILPQIQIPRHVAGEPTIISYQLHGFCDASTKAYGSAVYLCTINDANEITVNLLCAKSRVAPQRQLTLPRLELCAALLLVRLMRLITTALDIAPIQAFCWTDSQIVLSWIGSPSYGWKTFVANRVAEIQNFNTTWHYVKSELNPADLISRGCTVTQLQYSNRWWRVPQFLHGDNQTWGCFRTEGAYLDPPGKENHKSNLCSQHKGQL